MVLLRGHGIGVVFDQTGRDGFGDGGVTGGVGMDAVAEVGLDPFVVAVFRIGLDDLAGIPVADAAGEMGIIRLGADHVVEGLAPSDKIGEAGFVGRATAGPSGTAGDAGGEGALDVGNAEGMGNGRDSLAIGPFEGGDLADGIMHPNAVDPVLVEEVGDFSLMGAVIAQDIDHKRRGDVLGKAAAGRAALAEDHVRIVVGAKAAVEAAHAVDSVVVEHVDVLDVDAVAEEERDDFLAVEIGAGQADRANGAVAASAIGGTGGERQIVMMESALEGEIGEGANRADGGAIVIFQAGLRLALAEKGLERQAHGGSARTIPSGRPDDGAGLDLGGDGIGFLERVLLNDGVRGAAVEGERQTHDRIAWLLLDPDAGTLDVDGVIGAVAETQVDESPTWGGAVGKFLAMEGFSLDVLVVVVGGGAGEAPRGQEDEALFVVAGGGTGGRRVSPGGRQRKDESESQGPGCKVMAVHFKFRWLSRVMRGG